MEPPCGVPGWKYSQIVHQFTISVCDRTLSEGFRLNLYTRNASPMKTCWRTLYDSSQHFYFWVCLFVLIVAPYETITPPGKTVVTVQGKDRECVRGKETVLGCQWNTFVSWSSLSTRSCCRYGRCHRKARLLSVSVSHRDISKRLPGCSEGTEAPPSHV